MIEEKIKKLRRELKFYTLIFLIVFAFFSGLKLGVSKDYSPMIISYHNTIWWVLLVSIFILVLIYDYLKDDEE